MSELRRDPLRRRWVVLSNDRGRLPLRPPRPSGEARDDARCALCQASTSGGAVIAQRSGPVGPVTVLANRFPVLEARPGGVNRWPQGRHDGVEGIGAHEIVVEAPTHDLDLSDMAPGQVAQVLRSWRDRLADLQQDRRLRWIQVVRDRGREAGARTAHPYSQVIALPVVPELIARQGEALLAHWEAHERCLVCDLLADELAARDRVVRADDRFVSLCPYASPWPFFVEIVPRAHDASYARATDEDLEALAGHLVDVLRRVRVATADVGYHLSLITVPNTADGAPPDSASPAARRAAWHWRLEVTPQLWTPTGLCLTTGVTINPTSPEDAAAHLRTVDVPRPPLPSSL